MASLSDGINPTKNEKKKPGLGEIISSAIPRGIDNLQASLAGGVAAVGDKYGIKGLQNLGSEIQQRNMQEAAQNPYQGASWDEAKKSFSDEGIISGLKNTAGFAANSFAENIPQGAEALAEYGIGRKIGKKLGASDVQSNALAGGLALGSNYLQGAGQMYGDMPAGAENRADIALKYAVPHALLDTATDLIPAGKIFGNGLGAGGIVADTMKAGAKQALAEIPTEGAQSVIERAAVARTGRAEDPSDRRIFSDKGLTEIEESMAAGGFAGGVTGAGAELGGRGIDALTGRNSQQQDMNENQQDPIPYSGQDPAQSLANSVQPTANSDFSNEDRQPIFKEPEIDPVASHVQQQQAAAESVDPNAGVISRAVSLGAQTGAVAQKAEQEAVDKIVSGEPLPQQQEKANEKVMQTASNEESTPISSAVAKAAEQAGNSAAYNEASQFANGRPPVSQQEIDQYRTSGAISFEDGAPRQIPDHLADADPAIKRAWYHGWDMENIRSQPDSPQAETNEEMQNRDRTRMDSQVQLSGIARNPDYDRVSQSKTPATGAPMAYMAGDEWDTLPAVGNEETVTGSDGRKIQSRYAVIEAGQLQPSNDATGKVNKAYNEPLQPGVLRALNNGRSAGLKAAYDNLAADDYRAALTADAEKLGMDPAVINSMENPILIRVYSEKDNVGDMGAWSNQSDGLRLSPAEQAKTDARMLGDLHDIVLDDDGDFDSKANMELVHRFVNSLPATEAAGLRKANGEPNVPLVADRLRNAMLVSAYGDDDLVNTATESRDEARNLVTALSGAAAKFSSLADGDRTGVKNLVVRAAQMFRKAKADKTTVEQLGKQVDLAGGFSPEEEAVAEYIEQNIKSAKRVAKVLKWLGEYSRQVESSAGSMFGDDLPATKQAAIAFANQQIAEEMGDEARQIKSAESNERPRESQAEGAHEGAVAGTGSSGGEAFSLESYTEEEIAQREAGVRAASEAEAQAARDAENKAKADAEIDQFTLSGSDRQADTAVAAGQNDMFGAVSQREKTNSPEISSSQQTNTQESAEIDGEIQQEPDEDQQDAPSVTYWADRASDLHDVAVALRDKIGDQPNSDGAVAEISHEMVKFQLMTMDHSRGRRPTPEQFKEIADSLEAVISKYTGGQDIDGLIEKYGSFDTKALPKPAKKNALAEAKAKKQAEDAAAQPKEDPANNNPILPPKPKEEAPQTTEEPNLVAARDLIDRYKKVVGNKLAEGKIRKEMLALARKTDPNEHEKTGIMLDMLATRLGYDGDMGWKQPTSKPQGLNQHLATAPEHVDLDENAGVSVEEMEQIAKEFRKHIDGGGDAEVTHVFDAPAKGEIIRLNDKAKVHVSGKGWMTPEEAKAEIDQWKANAAAQGKTGKNSDKIVLSLFDLSGEWSKPWEEAGYQVYRFDIQNGETYEDEDGNEKKSGDINNLDHQYFADMFGYFDGNDVHAILAASPCTDFAVSGARHFAAKDADGRTVASIRLVKKTLALIEHFKPAVWALENPVGRIENLTGLPPWRLSFDPNHLGDTYTKKTLIWGRFNADLPIAPVDPTEGSKMHKRYGGKSLATKNARSVTPEGFAYAFFQANNAIDNPVLAVAGKYDRLDKEKIKAAIDAGITPAQIDELVEDYYYQEMDDEAANEALNSAAESRGDKKTSVDQVTHEGMDNEDGSDFEYKDSDYVYVYSPNPGELENHKEGRAYLGKEGEWSVIAATYMDAFFLVSKSRKAEFFKTEAAAREWANKNPAKKVIIATKYTRGGSLEIYKEGAKAEETKERPMREQRLIASGEQLYSATGRKISPAPKIDTSSRGKLSNSMKRMHQWIYDEAMKEAVESGSDWNQTLVKGIQIGNLSTSDLETLNNILFGDFDGVSDKNRRPGNGQPIDPRGKSKLKDISAGKQEEESHISDAAEKAEKDQSGITARSKAKPKKAIDAISAIKGILNGDDRVSEDKPGYGDKNGDDLNSEQKARLGQASLQLAEYYFDSGLTKFSDFARQMLNDIGTDKIKPFIEAAYMGGRANLRQTNKNLYSQTDKPDTVEALVDSGFLDDMKGKDIIGADAEDNQDDSEIQSEKPSLKDFIIERMNDIKDNNDLKKMLAEFHGQPATEAQIKEGQEAFELGLVLRARDVVADDDDMQSTFNELLEIYNNQPLLNSRSSTSMENQAYSTPLPLAYLAGKLAGIDASAIVYEPTAGNGALVMAATPENTHTNELNDSRRDALKDQGFVVTGDDATGVIDLGVANSGGADSVVMNPPFGALDGGARVIDGYSIGKIDHLIAMRALKNMKNNGRAVMIIGANKEAGAISRQDRIFFNWLYGHYNVVDHFEVDGKMYSRQGAGWPVAVITIDGRKSSDRVSPKENEIVRIGSWEQVYEHAEQTLDSIRQESSDRNAGSTVSSGAQQAGLFDDPGLPRGEAKPTGKGVRSGAGRGRSGSSSQGSGDNTGGSAGVEPGQAGGDADGKRSGADGDKRDGSGADNARPDGESGNSGAIQKYDPSRSNTGNSSSRNVKGSGFQASYVSGSKLTDDGALVPVNMQPAIEYAIDTLKKAVGGDIDSYVMEKLKYTSQDEYEKAFMGLQADTIAAAIYNMEVKGKGIIIADQTGVGKGRQGAGIIRWAIKNGKIPVFVTVKPNLFTDIYDDSLDIGLREISPFIMNKDGADIQKNGRALFSMTAKQKSDAIKSMAKTGELPDKANALFMTYSQITSSDAIQRDALSKLVSENSDKVVFILDESHNVAGDREKRKKIKAGGSLVVRTGAGFMNDIITGAPVTYLSATYAKRPDNMPVYHRTDLMDAVDSVDDLINAAARGGEALQTVIANALARNGQLWRREKSYEGIEIKTIVESKSRLKHEKLSDKVTNALKTIIDADNILSEWLEHGGSDSVLQHAGITSGSASHFGGAVEQHASHSPFTSIVHNYVRQMLLGLKADWIVEEAIALKRAGKKPVIALENTMESFLKDAIESGDTKVGDTWDGDFSMILQKALKRTARITVEGNNGERTRIPVPESLMPPVVRSAYKMAMRTIDAMDVSDIPIMPIDYIRHKLEQSGISTGEITGRSLFLDYSGGIPVVSRRSEIDMNRRGSVDRFNAGDIDAIILNSAGSTGLSIHARKDYADLRPRHMLVAQPMLDINIMMQMLGRINRTGQVVLPEYSLMGLDLPAEKRPLAITNRKMASLNANTSANTKSDTSLNAPDIMNKYGARVISDFLMDNMDIAMAINVSPDAGEDAGADFAIKATGRFALLPVEVQRYAYDEIERSYADLIAFLDATGQNDLKTETYDLNASIIDTTEVYEGKFPGTQLGGNAYLHHVSVNKLGSPPSAAEVHARIKESLRENTPGDIVDAMISESSGQHEKMLNESIEASITSMVKKYEEAKDDKERELIQARLAKLHESKEAAVAAADETASMLRKLTIGTEVKLDIGDDVVTGVVVNVVKKYKEGVGSPWAASKYDVIFAVNSTAQYVTMPLSNMRMSAGKLEHSGKPSRDRVSAPVDDIFKPDSFSTATERRYIATGNLVGAFAKLPGGRVINFTAANGKQYQGILMPRKFGDKEMQLVSGAPKSVRDASLLAKYLRDLERGSILADLGIFSGGNMVRIAPAKKGDGYTVTIPSKADTNGDKIKFDKDLHALMGDEFTGRGKYMVANVNDAAIEAVISKIAETVSLSVPSIGLNNLDRASGVSKKPPVRSFDIEGLDTDGVAYSKPFKADEGQEALERKAFGGMDDDQHAPAPYARHEPGDSGSIIVTEGKDTRDGSPYWSAKVKPRLGDHYSAVASMAKRNGGGWSRFAKGFKFSSEEAANKFAEEARSYISDSGIRESDSGYSVEEKGRKNKSQGDLFVRPVDRRTAAARGGKEEQIDMFNMPTPKKDPAAQVRDNLFVKIASQSIGHISVGIETVNNRHEAAHVFAPFRKHAQETMLILVLDKDSKPLQIIRHSKGAKDSATVTPAEIVGAATSIDGAASLWLAHNHPSGISEPSEADRRITAKIAKVLEGTGIELKGHVVLGDRKTSAIYTDPRSMIAIDDVADGSVRYRPAARTKGKVQITERVIRKRLPSEAITLSSPSDARSAMKDISAPDAVILLDTQHRVIGNLHMTIEEMLNLKSGGQVNRLWRAIDSTNASAIMVKVTSESGTRALEAANNVNAFINNSSDVRFLDSFIDDGSGTLQSSAEKGMFVTKDTFFRKKSDPAVGVTRGQAQKAVDAFLKSFRGANDVEIVIYDNAEQAFGRKQLEFHKMVKSRFKGAYQNGRVVLFLDGHSSVDDVTNTLRHEIWAHYGFDLVPAIVKQKALKQIKDLIGQSGDLYDQYEQVKAKYRYDDGTLPSEAKLIEELVARLAEKHGDKIHKASTDDSLIGMVRRIFDAILNALRSAGYLTQKDGVDRVVDMITGVARNLHKGSGWQTHNNADVDMASRSQGSWYFSPLQRAVADMKQEKGSPEQMLAMISRVPGVKPAEIEATGLKEYLDIVSRPTPDGVDYVHDYYGDAGAREVAHAAKNGDKAAIRKMAKSMAAKIPSGSTLVPVPSRTGKATMTLDLANEIAKITGSKVADVLSGAERESLYDIKKSGRRASVSDLGFKASGKAVINPVLIDNVFATGLTLDAAKAALPEARMVAYARDTKAMPHKPATVTKQQIMDYLQGNGVQVQEKILGAFNVPALPDGWTIEETDDGFEVLDDDGEFRGVGATREQAILDAMDADESADNPDSAGQTKFGQYQLPGGQNYRELLLTLPGKKEEGKKLSFDEAMTQIKEFRNPVELRIGGEFARNLSEYYSLEENRESIESGEFELFSYVYGDGRKTLFSSSHFDQPNILAHVRFNERTDAEGKRVLFIEEIQSDWAQAGRKLGFNGPAKDASVNVVRVDNGFSVLVDGNPIWSGVSEDRANEVAARKRAEGPKVSGVPSAPFVTSTDAWVGLSMKRMIAYAAENGFDRIAWTTGEQQADRYDLSKQINAIRFVKHGNGLFTAYASKDGRVVASVERKQIGDVADMFGNDIAEKIENNEREEGTLRGVDLKVGGEGMKSFYNNIVPKVAKEVTKKMGGRLTEVNFAQGGSPRYKVLHWEDDFELGEYDTKEEAERAAFVGVSNNPNKVVQIAGANNNQPGFDITPEMRDAVESGLPLFRRNNNQTKTPAFKRWFGNSKVIDKNGDPMVVYHNTPSDRIRGTDSFREFDDGANYFATPADEQYGDYSLPVYLSIQNPYTGFDKETGAYVFADGTLAKEESDYDEDEDEDANYITVGFLKENPHIIDDMISRGYDGAMDGHDFIVPFNPGQIKSAISNNGEFNPLNPGIMFRRGESAVLAEESPLYKTRTAEQAGAVSKAKADEALKIDATAQKIMAKGNTIKNGDLVGVRLNINVLNRTGVPVQSIHKGGEGIRKKMPQPGNQSGFYNGEVLTYAPHAVLRNVYFTVHQPMREKIASGSSSKTPMASADGEWVSTDNPSFDGVLARFNPHGEHLFIDQKGRAVKWAEEATIMGHRAYLRGEIEYYQPGEAPAKAGESATKAIFYNPEQPPEQLDDLFFRRAAEGDQSALDSLKVMAQDRFAKDLNTFGWWHKSVGTQYHKAWKDKDYKKIFDQAQYYLNDTNRFAMESADLAPGLLPKVDSLADIFKSTGASKADIEAIADPIYKGTLVDEKVYSRDELVSQFNLNPRQIGLYTEFRKAINHSLNAMVASEIAAEIKDDPELHSIVMMAKYRPERALDEVIEALRSRAEDLEAEALRIEKMGAPEKLAKPYRTAANQARKQLVSAKEKLDKLNDLKLKGYAPLMRFGKYTVTVQNDLSGEIEYFEMFESQADARKMEREMQEAWRGSASVSTGVMSQEAFRLYAGMSPDTLDLFGTAIGFDKSQSDVFQDYLRLSRNNRSALKRLIRRKGTAGFSKDVTRSLASFITSNSRQASSNWHMGEMDKKIEELRSTKKHKGDVIDEAVKLVDYLRNPREEAAGLRNLLFVNFIGGSIASAITNMTQPITMTAPYLSQFGSATKHLLSAQKIAVGGNAEGELGKAMTRAIDEGLLAPHEVYQLHSEAIRNLGSSLWARKAITAWGRPFALAEAYNRRLTFAAAYNMAKENPGSLAKAKVSSAYAFAVKAVQETQGIYNKGNRPNWGRGALGATVFTFKQYSIGYLEFVRRLPRKQQMQALGILFLMAGLNGLPFADDLEDLIDTIAQAMGYSLHSKSSLRNVAISALGKNFGEFVANGVSALPGSPLDVQARMGLGNLIPGTSILKKSSTDRGRDAAEALGAVGGLIQQVGKGATKILSGDLAGAAKAVAPVAVRNALTGVNMIATGRYTDEQGRLITKNASASEGAIKMTGFNPSRIASESRNVQGERQKIALARQIEGDIADRWAESIVENDSGKRQDAMESLRSWNRKNPETPIRLTPAQIRSRVMAMNVDRKQRLMKTAPKEMRSSVRQGLE